LRAVAEAPTKAIITGEHFVVHGALAFAAAIPLKVRVEMVPSDKFEAISDRFKAPGSPQLTPIARVVESMGREFTIKPTVKVSIHSAVPGGAGLGSSAATMVAVASAFSRLNSLGLRVDEIIRCSMVGEQHVHGTPSGIDPAICARGGAILFRPGAPPKKVALDHGRSLILAYSGIDRSTRGQIGRVARTKEEYPEFFSTLVKGVSDLSIAAAGRLQAGDMKRLGGILALNHAILKTVGVSNETLDSMVNLLVSLGCYGAKLTGAGGGGSVLAIAPEAKEKRIVSGLSARGFETFRVKIPVEGVKSWLER
jgi:mevalonate kinase